MEGRRGAFETQGFEEGARSGGRRRGAGAPQVLAAHVEERRRVDADDAGLCLPDPAERVCEKERVS